MSDIAYTSMHDKPCISTPNCQGIYIYLEVVQEDNETKVKVKCNVCNTQIDKFIPT